MYDRRVRERERERERERKEREGFVLHHTHTHTHTLTLSAKPTGNAAGKVRPDFASVVRCMARQNSLRFKLPSLL